MLLQVTDIAALVGIGAAAGVLGGMLGIGGSIVMIPAMAILFAERSWHSQHLYQAAAMIINVAVAVPAARTHHANRAIPKRLVQFMLPATLVTIVIGVLVSDMIPASWLQKLFALFVAYVAIATIVRTVRNTPEHDPEDQRVTPARGSTVGGVMGSLAGLLGIGGGVIAVPLAHMVCRLPLKQCIAASATVMCFTAGVGAAIKVARMPTHGFSIADPILIALCLAPFALLGAHLGAGLTHRLPVRKLRIVFAVTLFLIAGRMFVGALSG